MNRRQFVQASALGVLGTGINVHGGDVEGRLLPNGIRLPAQWPPRLQLSTEPMVVPYLSSPPAVIPIDLGRQLFVDNFLIEDTNLRRTFHQARYHEATPVLRPDQKWEQTRGAHCAMVFSDGVWYDSQDKRFKMWYMGGYGQATCLATSSDGIKWDKPLFDVEKGTNIVHPGRRDSVTVWLDHEEKDRDKRFKLFRSLGSHMDMHVSADGIHWRGVGATGPCGDRSTIYYDPFRRVWVYSLRLEHPKLGRCRGYLEHADAIAGGRWKGGQRYEWVGADRLDPVREDLKTRCQLYNLDGVAYESLMLGLFSIWRGQPRDRAKPNEIVLGFSRDGFHWDRPNRAAFCPVSERHGDWNWGNVQSAGGCCLVVDDKLYFYVSGRAGIRGLPMSGICTTGLATIRRDGFVSRDAGDKEGTLTTRPVQFRGRRLFVNVDAPKGELRVEVLDAKGAPLAPFTGASCMPITGDRTRQAVTWKEGDLAKLAGQTVKFRFRLRNGKLFAFWVSPTATGASHGFVGAGGPGFERNVNTVGGR